ncbi:hypothetical protein BASA62_004614 [Batrachochytrium salamandrivorans]|nr:hypothetical protein BASA62_004614 [Batrachochytrium salamandrivorans]
MPFSLSSMLLPVQDIKGLFAGSARWHGLKCDPLCAKTPPPQAAKVQERACNDWRAQTDTQFHLAKKWMNTVAGRPGELSIQAHCPPPWYCLRIDFVLTERHKLLSHVCNRPKPLGPKATKVRGFGVKPESETAVPSSLVAAARRLFLSVCEWLRWTASPMGLGKPVFVTCGPQKESVNQ